MFKLPTKYLYKDRKIKCSRCLFKKINPEQIKCKRDLQKTIQKYRSIHILLSKSSYYLQFNHKKEKQNNNKNSGDCQ